MSAAEASPRRVVVTGASGFVGRVIAARLSEAGFDVEAWYRTAPADVPGVRWRRVELREATLAGAGEGAGAFVHAAAFAHARTDAPGRALLRSVNVGGTSAALSVARAAGARRFVFLSSVKAGLGDGPPEGAYGEAKAEGEALVRRWTEEAPEREGAALRLPLVHGPGVKGNLALLAAFARRGLVVTVGEGRAERSLVAASNVADAVLALLEAGTRPGFRRYFLADETPYSVREIGETLARASGRRVRSFALPAGPARLLARAGDAGERLLGRPLPWSSDVLARLTEAAVVDASRFRAEYGWLPRRSLADDAPAILGGR